MHSEELHNVYCLENAMGVVSVHSRGCTRERKTLFGGRNKSRLRVDIVRAVVTQDAIVTCNRKQQSCESYGFVAVSLQIASLW